VAQAGGQKQEFPQIAIGVAAFVHAGLELLVVLQQAHRLAATHSRNRQPTGQQYLEQVRLALLTTPPHVLQSLDRSLGFLTQNRESAHSPALPQQD
jgi:hypothetical protein